MTDGKSSWWQTVPGILTAIAGIITATGGLLLTLSQVGILGTKGKPPASSPSSSGSTPTAPASTAQPVPARRSPYSVTFPSGDEVKLTSSRADGVYKVLATKVDDRNTGTLLLTFSIRLTNIGRSDLAFGSDSFRLVIDGVPRTPINSVIAAVDARSAKDAEFVFEMPEVAGSLVLFIENGQDKGNIPLVLKKSG